jgi:outer membrane protein assembly factor BamB
MKRNRPLLILGLMAVALLLSACGGTGFGASSWPGLTLDAEDGTVYVAYNQHVYALQAENGVERWRFPAERDNAITFYAAPELTEDGQLVIGGYNNVLYSLDPANNGSLNWSFDVAANRFVAGPQSIGGTVYSPNSDRSMYALDSAGKLQWTFGSAEALWAQPAADGGSLYVPSMDHILYAVDAASGNLLWEQDLGGTIVGQPALDEDGTLYVGTFGAEVVAVDSASGRILWASPTNDWVWGGPTVADGVVYAADLSGTLFAFDADRGTEMWQLAADGAITGSPLFANDHIYVGTENGQLLSVGLDGRIQWTQTLEGQLYSPPLAAGDLILVGIVDTDAIVMALDLNGQIQWSFIP